MIIIIITTNLKKMRIKSELQKNAAGTRTLRGKPLLGPVSGEGPEQGYDASYVQRALVISTTGR